MTKKTTSRVLVLVLVLLMFSGQVFASSGLLRVGSRGSAVVNLQKQLNSLGYNAGAADGIFGSRTRSAVMSFQRANGLAVDGIVGPATRAKLNASPGSANKTESKPQNPPTTGGSNAAPITGLLRQGSRGSQVKTLQERLNSLGYNAGTADGIFGSRTRSAVIAFQRANKLAADGIVGPATIAKLYPPTSESKP
ncbi:MAG: peptidoglycan-binding protein, partial [Clostridiales bacterium]|nr:peptidoglycan-binding protein [Clostridiales bacterium]